MTVSTPAMPSANAEAPSYVPQSGAHFALAYCLPADHPLAILTAACVAQFYHARSLDPTLPDSSGKAGELSFQEFLRYQQQAWKQVSECLKRLEQARSEFRQQKRAELAMREQSQKQQERWLKQQEQARQEQEEIARLDAERLQLQHEARLQLAQMGIRLPDFSKLRQPEEETEAPEWEQSVVHKAEEEQAESAQSKRHAPKKRKGRRM